MYNHWKNQNSMLILLISTKVFKLRVYFDQNAFYDIYFLKMFVYFFSWISYQVHPAYLANKRKSCLQCTYRYFDRSNWKIDTRRVSNKIYSYSGWARSGTSCFLDVLDVSVPSKNWDKTVDTIIW